MNAESRSAAWYVDHLLDDVERFAAAVELGALDAPIEACPGWDLRHLTHHLGSVHRWARQSAATAKQPESFGTETPDDDELAGWLRAGAHELAETLLAIDPAGATWSPFPVEQVGAIWPRRQAMETMVHRWDAETAVGIRATLDAELASDGIDEYFAIALPRLIQRGRANPPTGSLHLHCTDIAGEWLIWTEGSELKIIREHSKGDAALRGPAEAILLKLWNRKTPRADELSPVGDESVLAGWLTIAGM
jgi:uncharacterized protein (TIGR03083 family)